MNWYRYAGNIKAGLFVLGIILVSAFVIYTQRIVNDLREDNREIVQLYAEIIAGVAAEDDDANLNFIFENIIQKVQFPLIQSDTEKNPISWRNLPEEVDDSEKALRIRKTMDNQNEPIPLIFENPANGEIFTFGYLHFGDSHLINRLIWLPYLQIALVGLFILLGFTGFSVIRNSEKRHIWVGMARETAHQLGTPVSALLGWVDRLKNYPDRSTTIIDEMEADLDRLQQISNRFSDMGAEPKFQTIDILQLINNTGSYLRRRIPGVNINIDANKSLNISINGNEKLLSWAIENVVKNGIDATQQQNTEIDITLQKIDSEVIIDIIDNGKGIPKRDWKNIFRPGFSTKKHGWGLGLSLTKRIIHEIHKGKIFVKNSSLEQGTTIRIII